MENKNVTVKSVQTDAKEFVYAALTRGATLEELGAVEKVGGEYTVAVRYTVPEDQQAAFGGSEVWVTIALTAKAHKPRKAPKSNEVIPAFDPFEEAQAYEDEKERVRLEKEEDARVKAAIASQKKAGKAAK